MSEFISKPNFYVEGKDVTISKSNALVEAAYELSPSEHDLLTLAINKLHNQGTGGKQVFITAKEFAIANKINENYAYAVLKETAQKLYDRKLSCTLYYDELKEISGEEDIYSVVRPQGSNKPIRLNFRWLQAVAYQEKNGFIHLLFSDPMAYLIGKTGEAYTKYDYAKTIDLNGFHTKRLYELVNKWKGAKPTNGNKHPQIVMALEEWKEFFGCADKYDKTAEFKRRVLLPSIDRINDQKDFTLTLDQEKVGRIITHFVITIKDNQEPEKKKFKDPFRDADTVDIFTGATDRELKPLNAKTANMFGNMLGYDSVFGAKYARQGESMPSFVARIKSELQTVEGVIRYAGELKKIGYKSNYKPSR